MKKEHTENILFHQNLQTPISFLSNKN